MAKIQIDNPINDFSGTGGALPELDGQVTPRIKFPGDIETTQHFVTFQVRKRTKLRYYQPHSKEQIIGEVKLPLPSTISTGYSARYESTELGAIGSYGVDVIEEKGFEQAAKEIGSSIQSQLAKITAGDASFNDLKPNEIMSRLAFDFVNSNAATIATTLAAGITGGSRSALAAGIIANEATQAITAGIAAGFQVARNPHLAQLYIGSNFRTHTFSYKLIARERSDIESIKGLIYLFKYHMSPDYSENTHFLKYPAVFDIEFSNDKYMHKFGTSILSEFSINYTGENTPIFFNNDGDSAPYSVVINLSFTELDIVTKREIEKGF
jgi:hypothetical protein